MIATLPEPLQPYFCSDRRQARRMLANILFLHRETTFLRDIEAEDDIPDEELATLRCPVLCIYGRDSSVWGVGERLARVIPGARLATMDGGHYVHLDAPQDVTRALLEFVGA